MKLRKVLSDFQEYLKSSYPNLPVWITDGKDSNEPIGDWYQTNWEILVEYRIIQLGLVDGIIDIYADGADCNNGSSRVFLPDLIAKESIRINNEFIFHSFGTQNNGIYLLEPPFEFVKGENPMTKNIIVEKFENAKFSIGPSYNEYQ